jgi:hypothetical protein
MIINKGDVRYKIVKLRRPKPLGAYLVQFKILNVPMLGYRDAFYAATEEVAILQIDNRHASGS